MKPVRPVLFVVFALAACSSSGDEVTGADSSSSTGTNDDGEGDSPTDPTVTPTDSSGDTTCADGCATSEGDSTSGSITSVDGSSSSSGPGESSSETTPGESSSSEGPTGDCGNGAIEGAEDCDDAGESATCDDDCTFAECGDDTLNVSAGEICDQGGESFSCDSDCTPPVCGDLVVNESHDEVCDEGGSTPTCDSDCTPPLCGDGTQNLTTLETCDDGNNLSNDGCSSNCVIEGEFGGECRIVDGTQWCFDNDHCGEACADVCATLGLTLESSDATWFAAQDTVGECQAIANALSMDAPIQFDASPLGCLEDAGLNDLTGGGLTGGLLCSSDPDCPAAHREDMDDLGGICDIAGARRSICPCIGAFCGNGLVEGGEVCDDGNEINNDGCNTSCGTGPNVCEEGVDPDTGSPYVVCVVDGAGAWVAHADDMGGEYHPEVICQELGYTGFGAFGGTCGNSCGYCDMFETSCESTGTEIFDGSGDCGMDDIGFIACGVVHWTCI
jgi:cysteine-rich repeat protein